MEVGDARTTLSCVDARLEPPSLWRPRYKWDWTLDESEAGMDPKIFPSQTVRNSRKRLDSGFYSSNFFFVASIFINLVIISLTWAAETETVASVTQRESNRLHDAPLLYTPRTITEASTFPRERQGRRGVREARASRVPPGPLPSSPDGLGPDRGLARRVRRALGS